MKVMNTCSIDKARAAKPRVQDLLRGVPQLAGVGITRVEKGYGVKVNLSAEPAAGVQVPTEVDGVPVRVEVVGRISKRGER
ncbi:MAG: hypothetical protein HYV26_01675 [Candidatus Hydrogenedentes bacterium]|nr:hypothetical protein [Candidatus Hydrogenedentota bacterium]